MYSNKYRQARMLELGMENSGPPNVWCSDLAECVQTFQLGDELAVALPPETGLFTHFIFPFDSI